MRQCQISAKTTFEALVRSRDLFRYYCLLCVNMLEEKYIIDYR